MHWIQVMIQLVFLPLYFSKGPAIFYHFVLLRNSFQNFQNLPFLPPFGKDLFIAIISDFFSTHHAKDSCIVDSNTTATTFWSWLNHFSFVQKARFMPCVTYQHSRFPTKKIVLSTAWHSYLWKNWSPSLHSPFF